MTPFEFAYRALLPALSPLNVLARRELRAAIARHRGGRPVILDVGGRKSPYTVGLEADVVVSELPRASALQAALNLGLTPALEQELRRRRSNVRAVVLGDMTRTALAPQSVDVVAAVEVLEHVEEDERFVANVARVLRPGGAFVMTTPNGDAVPIPHNADHKRHYPRSTLEALLRRHFTEVTVRYAVRQSAFRRAGLRTWSPRRPVSTVAAMGGSLVCLAHSSLPGAGGDALGTRHLLAVARGPRTAAPAPPARTGELAMRG